MCTWNLWSHSQWIWWGCSFMNMGRRKLWRSHRSTRSIVGDIPGATSNILRKRWAVYATMYDPNIYLNLGSAGIVSASGED